MNRGEALFDDLKMTYGLSQPKLRLCLSDLEGLGHVLNCCQFHRLALYLQRVRQYVQVLRAGNFSVGPGEHQSPFFQSSVPLELHGTNTRGPWMRASMGDGSSR